MALVLLECDSDSDCDGLLLVSDISLDELLVLADELCLPRSIGFGAPYLEKNTTQQKRDLLYDRSR